jgi:hypothetical protein
MKQVCAPVNGDVRTWPRARLTHSGFVCQCFAMAKLEPHERLYLWRRDKGKTLQEVADCAGKTRQWAYKLENGELDIPVGKLSIICRKVLGIDIETFFGQLPQPKGKAA